MLKKCITLLLLTAQASMHAADQTNNKAPQSILIDIRSPLNYFQTKSIISMPITKYTTFGELESALSKAISCPVTIENGLKYPNVDYNHLSHSYYRKLIDAQLKVKNSMWCSPACVKSGYNLKAYLPLPSETDYVEHGKGIV
jgi:hypothetical protein